MNHRKINGKLKSERWYRRMTASGNIILTRDFSTVEDAPNSFEIIRNIVYRAGKNAAAEAKVAGLPYIFARKNQIVQQKQSGEEEILETAEASPVKLNSFYIRYKPSTILHARKK